MDKGKIEAMVTKFSEKFVDATPTFQNRSDPFGSPCICLNLGR